MLAPACRQRGRSAEESDCQPGRENRTRRSQTGILLDGKLGGGEFGNRDVDVGKIHPGEGSYLTLWRSIRAFSLWWGPFPKVNYFLCSSRHGSVWIWVLIHEGLKHERCGCSMPPSETRWD